MSEKGHKGVTTMSEKGQLLYPTAAQLRAARALCGLSQEALAIKTRKTTKTIQRAEKEGNSVGHRTLSEIKLVLESEGVMFIPENGGGAGVRLRK